MFNSLKNFASSAASAARSSVSSAISIVSSNSPSQSRESSQVEVAEDDQEAAVVALSDEEPALQSIDEDALASLPREFTDEIPTTDDIPDDEYDAIPDSTYFHRNNLHNIAVLPPTEFSINDPHIAADKLQFMCRRKKIPASGRIHSGSVKKHGKVTHFSRRVYVPPREVIEIIACDGSHVWRGDADWNQHNVTRFHKGDTWNIHNFNDIIEEALCFADEHPGLHYLLKNTLEGVESGGEVGEGESGGAREQKDPDEGEGRAVSGDGAGGDGEEPTSQGDQGKLMDALPPSDFFPVSNLLLDMHGSKELDDTPKMYINDGCVLRAVRPDGATAAAHNNDNDNDNDNDINNNNGNIDTPTQFQILMHDLVLRRFCSLACAGNLRFAKRFHRRFGAILDVNGEESVSGWCPIHFATHRGSLEFLKWLVDDLNVSPASQARDRKTTLHIAVAKNHIDIVRWVLSLDCGLTLGDEYVEEDRWTRKESRPQSSSRSQGLGRGQKGAGRSVLSLMVGYKRTAMLRECLSEESEIVKRLYGQHGMGGWVRWRAAAAASVAVTESESASDARGVDGVVGGEQVVVGMEGQEKTGDAAQSLAGDLPTALSAETATQSAQPAAASQPQVPSGVDASTTSDASVSATGIFADGNAVPATATAVDADAAAVTAAAQLVRQKRFGPMYFTLPKFTPDPPKVKTDGSDGGSSSNGVGDDNATSNGEGSVNDVTLQ